MKRIDLDDLPPKVAKTLADLEPGEELVLVQGGLVAARLTAAAPPPAEPSEPEPAPQERAAEIFEHFRSAIEEDF